MDPKVITVIDDDVSLRRSISSLLRSYGFRTILYDSGENFLASDVREADCIICDVQMSGISGIDVYIDLQRHGISTPFLFITAASADEIRARLGDGVPVFQKPFDAEALATFVQRMAA